MPENGQHTCTCWSCWLQGNFTPIVLFFMVVISLVATVILMHEDKIDDKYVTWLEGFCGGAMTSLAVSLKGSNATVHEPPPQLPSGTRSETTTVTAKTETQDQPTA